MVRQAKLGGAKGAARFESPARELGRTRGMHRRAKLEGDLRRKPNPKGAQAGARKRSEESDEAIVAGKRAITHTGSVPAAHSCGT